MYEHLVNNVAIQTIIISRNIKTAVSSLEKINVITLIRLLKIGM